MVCTLATRPCSWHARPPSLSGRPNFGLTGYATFKTVFLMTVPCHSRNFGPSGIRLTPGSTSRISTPPIWWVPPI